MPPPCHSERGLSSIQFRASINTVIPSEASPPCGKASHAVTPSSCHFERARVSEKSSRCTQFRVSETSPPFQRTSRLSFRAQRSGVEKSPSRPPRRSRASPSSFPRRREPSATVTRIPTKVANNPHPQSPAHAAPPPPPRRSPPPPRSSQAPQPVRPAESPPWREPVEGSLSKDGPGPRLRGDDELCKGLHRPHPRLSELAARQSGSRGNGILSPPSPPTPSRPSSLFSPSSFLLSRRPPHPLTPEQPFVYYTHRHNRILTARPSTPGL